MGREHLDLFRSALAEGADTLGIAVPASVCAGLVTHYELTLKWARRINLTTVVDPVEAARRHALDCLLFAEQFTPDATDAVVDVGSGGGFPGIALALARPKLQLELLEPIRKRASFLRVVLSALSRPDVSVREGRLFGDDPRRWQVDAIVSRATIPPLDLIALAPRFVRAGGRLILTGGAGAPPLEVVESTAESAGFASVRRSAYALPGGHSRVIDVLTRSVDPADPGD